MKRGILLLLLAACGGGSDGKVDASTGGEGPDVDAAIDAPSTANFKLTSPMLVEGASFNAANTCTGVNTSPQLTWTAGPAGTMSYAVVLTDKSNALIHWVIYDIPSTATGLPENVQKAYMPTNVTGAKQTTSYQATTRGYLGPCPPVLHTYEFVVYALSVATLPGVDMNSGRVLAEMQIKANDLAMASLSGTYMQ
jgi:Raf kinase inhibitor-like YbhB/YbcL family protein